MILNKLDIIFYPTCIETNPILWFAKYYLGVRN